MVLDMIRKFFYRELAISTSILAIYAISNADALNSWLAVVSPH
jgi:hypothetical protein